MVEDNLVDSAGCRRVEGIVVDDIDVTTELEPRDRLEQRYAVVGHEFRIRGGLSPNGHLSHREPIWRCRHMGIRDCFGLKPLEPKSVGMSYPQIVTFHKHWQSDQIKSPVELLQPY